MDFFVGKNRWQMTKAFVFGKFLPFHKGHEGMINFALTKCDFLTVLICCSDKEVIPEGLRKTWIEKTFGNHKNIEIKTFNYLESELTNTSVTSKEVSKIWADVFKNLFPDYSLLITSEDYGTLVAEFMEIKHIAFDISKTKFPISASAIRNNLFENWNFLPDSVKPDYAIKVVVLGTESTGKTTLIKKLANYYNCSFVLEAARDIIANSNSFTFADLSIVAEEHAKRIQNAMLANSPLVLIDTDVHTTKSYSRFVFENDLEVTNEIYNINKANLYLYLNPNVEFFQDGTRLDEDQRNLLDLSHKKLLQEHQIEFIEISGDWNNRFKTAVQEIDKILSIIQQNLTNNSMV